MTQSSATELDSMILESAKPANLDDLMEELGTQQTHKLQLEQELASTSGELARLNNKIVPLLTERIPTDIENLKTRMISLGAVEEGGRIRLKLPDATEIELRLDHNVYYAHETKNNLHIELIPGKQPSVIRVFGIDTVGAIKINDDRTIWLKERPTNIPITEALIEYTKILAWFQEQLTGMEDAKKSRELAETIKAGE